MFQISWLSFIFFRPRCVWGSYSRYKIIVERHLLKVIRATKRGTASVRQGVQSRSVCSTWFNQWRHAWWCRSAGIINILLKYNNGKYIVTIWFLFNRSWSTSMHEPILLTHTTSEAASIQAQPKEVSASSVARRQRDMYVNFIYLSIYLYYKDSRQLKRLFTCECTHTPS